MTLIPRDRVQDRDMYVNAVTKGHRNINYDMVFNTYDYGQCEYPVEIHNWIFI